MRSTSIPFKDVILTSDRLLDTKVVLVNPTTKEEIRAITSENIIDYKIEESLFSDDFEIGTTICSKLNINFLNLSETEAELRGYTLRVYLGLNINGETEYVELKDYYIDEIVVEKNKYSITAYDYMLKLDNEADLSEITGSYPDETEINYQDFIDFILSKNNTSIGFNGVDFNFSISVADIKKLKGYTYRQILTAIAGINACYISIATKDKLKIFKIDELEEKNVVKEIDGSAYFSYKQNNYLDIQTTKGSADGTIFITKGEGQQIYSFENQLLKDEHMDHIHNTLKKIKYYGYSLDFVGDFSLELGDIIKIITVEGIEQIVPITSINLTYKGSLRVLLESNIKTEDKLVENLTQGQKLEKAIDNVYAEFENGFGKGITKINADGIEVSHTAVGTKTLLSADGFRVLNAENEPIAWFSTEKDFAEIKATTVNADNITNIYTITSPYYLFI